LLHLHAVLTLFFIDDSILSAHSSSSCFFFFSNDTATTDIYTLSLHDALPILLPAPGPMVFTGVFTNFSETASWTPGTFSEKFVKDRKSTRLNSSHQIISYAVFCLKKKKK